MKSELDRILIIVVLVLCGSCMEKSSLDNGSANSDTESDSSADSSSGSDSTTGSGTGSEMGTDDSASGTSTSADTDTGSQTDSSTATVGDSDSEGDSQTTGDSGTGADTGSDSTQEWGTETDDVDTESESDTAPDTNPECEGVDFQTDAENCGGCQNDCLTNGELWPDYGDVVPENIRGATCNNGHCQVAECNSGFRDNPIFPFPDCDLYIRQVTAGSPSCALFSNNTVKCWGPNGRPREENFIPVEVAGFSPSSNIEILEVTSGRGHTCALLSDNIVQCWGENNSGQLGRDTGDETSDDTPARVEGLTVSPGVNILRVFAHEFRTCVLLSDDTIQCWGANGWGQLGRDTGAETFDSVPAPVEGLPVGPGVGIQHLSVGQRHSCVVLSDSTIECWGSNDYGQLGRDTGTAVAKSVPAKVEGIELNSGVFVSDVACGAWSTCALLTNNTIQCWGRNISGQLGRVTATDVTIDPAPVVGLNLQAGVSILELKAGGSYFCVRLSDDTIQCWGNNASGELGRDTGWEAGIRFDSDPASVEGISLDNGSKLNHLVTASYHACAVASDGSEWCWGKNTGGELGRDTGDERFDLYPPPNYPGTVENLF